MGRWKEFRKYQRSNRQEGRFLTYVDRVKRSLVRHGFTRPIELDKDPERQDKLTTWIEFLDYEHWFYDKDIRYVKRHQPEYDKAWKELVDSQVLKPDETEEFICNINSVFQHASETERAEKAVESAKSEVMSAQKIITGPRRSNLSEPEAQQRLAAAQSKLDAAVKFLSSIKRRSDFVYEFYKKTQLSQTTNDGKEKRSYQSAKDGAKRRSILLRWILQQIPVIELELNQAKITENDSNEEDGRKRLKRHPVDDLNEERVSKRRRENNRNNVLSDHETGVSTAPTSSQDSSTQWPPQTAGRKEQLKRNSRDVTGGGRATKRRRCSGQTSNTALISIAEPLSIQSNRSEPSNGIAQEPQEPRKSRRTAGHSPQFGMLPK